MKATFADGKATFETNHFSTYVIAYFMSTGVLVGIIVGAVVLVAAIVAVVIILMKKKK